MGIEIERMSWDDCWFDAKDERKVLDAFARKPRRRNGVQGVRHQSIEVLCTEGPLYGIDVNRTTDGRILLGEDHNREKLGGLEDCVKVLAPFMKNGIIYMEIWDGIWKWVFKDKKLLTVSGRVVYMDQLAEGYAGDAMWSHLFLPQGEPPDVVWIEVDQ